MPRALYVIGRGLGLGVAQEAALKLKETCGLHAEAFSSAEVRHGPMALVGAGFPLAGLQDDETRAGSKRWRASSVAGGADVMVAGGPGALELPTLRAIPPIEPMLMIQSFYRLANALASPAAAIRTGRRTCARSPRRSDGSALVNGRVLIDYGFVEDQAVLLDGGRIVDVVAEDDAAAARAPPRPRGECCCPASSTRRSTAAAACCSTPSRRRRHPRDRPRTSALRYHRISADPDQRRSQCRRARARAVRAAMAAGVPGVLGIHIEGPFLNVARKGVHDPAKFRGLDDSAIDLLTSLAAEDAGHACARDDHAGDDREARRGGRHGVGGPHECHYEEIRAALRHGLTGFTHLFNAMSQLAAREPGVVGAALEDPESWCGLIVDGRHVDPAVLRIALRCKRNDRFMLVTDAMPSVGTAEIIPLQGR